MNKLLIANGIILLAFLAVGFNQATNLIHLLSSILPVSSKLIVTRPDEGLFTWFTISFFLPLIAYIPILLVSIFLYAREALFEEERQFVKNNIFLSIILFLFGAAFGAWAYINFALPFFENINSLMGLTNYWTVGELTSQITLSAFGTGLLFLFPVLLNNLLNFELVTIQQLKQNRLKVALGLILLIIICPFLPSNPIEQAIIFIPIYTLYELTILLNKKR